MSAIEKGERGKRAQQAQAVK